MVQLPKTQHRLKQNKGWLNQSIKACLQRMGKADSDAVNYCIKMPNDIACTLLHLGVLQEKEDGMYFLYAEKYAVEVLRIEKLGMELIEKE